MNIRLYATKSLLLFSTLYLLVSNLHAAQPVENMYEARTLLENRSVAARDAAIAKGLEQVLIRYSGYSGVRQIAGVAEALMKADSYVVEFSVMTGQVPAEDGLTTQGAEELWVRFNASQVDRLVDQQQLPIWPTLRPAVKYMVVQELWGQPTQMTEQSYPAMTSQLHQVFSQRGLVAEEFKSSLMNDDQIWSLSEVDAYQLYNEAETELLVLVRVHSDQTNRQQSEVIVVSEAGLNLYRGDSGSALEDVAAGLNSFVDEYSVGYSFVGGSGQVAELFLSVLGMESFAEYKRLFDVLAEIDQVSAVRLEAMKGDQTMFRVAYGANYQRLLAAVSTRTSLVQHPNSMESLGIRENPFILVQQGYEPYVMPEPIFGRSDKPEIEPDSAVPVYELSVPNHSIGGS